MCVEKIKRQIEVPERIVPMDADLLREMDFNRIELRNEIQAIRKRASFMARNAVRLSREDAVKLNCGMELRNLQEESNSVAMYAGMIESLLDNLSDDTGAIFAARCKWIEDYKARVAENIEREKDAENKEYHAEYSRARRRKAREMA